MITATPDNHFQPVMGILVIVVSLTLWLVFGPVLALVAMHYMTALPESLSMYIGVHIPYIMMFLGLFLGAKFLLKTKLRLLLSGSERKFRWKFFFAAALIYIIFMAVAVPFVSGGVNKSGVTLTEYIITLFPVLLLTPIQAVSEEIFFRALPARIVYKDKLPQTLLEGLPLIIISGIIFMIPHLGNREVTSSASAILPMLCYFSWGSLAMFLALATDGFEAPAAMHAANNLFIALFVNYEGSSMPAKALFTAKSAGSLATLIETIIVFLILYLFALKSGKCIEGFIPRSKKQL